MMLNLQQHWYRPKLNLLTVMLLPFSWLFASLVCLRRFLYRLKIKKSTQLSVPVVVVGNITIGGTGKTPFVIWLAKLLKEKGWRPGIVSRGVGGQQQFTPRWVEKNSDPELVGDEAVLLALRSHCPVVIGIDRVAAAKELITQGNCNVVISDDGLQHYRLSRDMEIAIIDGERKLGNKQFLPAGPLRESPNRLKKVDFVVVQQDDGSSFGDLEKFSMQLYGETLISLFDSNQKETLKDFSEKKVRAVAAIGNPSRFFTTLRDHGFDIIEHVFPDHYLYKSEDFHFNDELPIIMTEKDAVKCRHFADKRFWCLPVEMKIDESFAEKLMKELK